MTAGTAKEFKPGMTTLRKVETVLDAGAACMFALAAGVALERALPYVFLLVAAAAWLLVMTVNLVSVGRVYVRVTDEEIAVFPGFFSNPLYCRWQDLESFAEVPGKKLTLKPKTGKTIVVHLGALVQPDRQELADAVRAQVERAGLPTARTGA